VEGLFTNRYQERPAEIDRYREAIEYLRDGALSPRDSTSLITEIPSPEREGGAYGVLILSIISVVASVLSAVGSLICAYEGRRSQTHHRQPKSRKRRVWRRTTAGRSSCCEDSQQSYVCVVYTEGGSIFRFFVPPAHGHPRHSSTI
jgi:hypothetical protein